MLMNPKPGTRSKSPSRGDDKDGISHKPAARYRSFARAFQSLFERRGEAPVRLCSFHPGCETQCDAYYDEYDLKLMSRDD